ncbi:hypothetical protein FB451DRAFT_1418351 [Mycena latifolia]|nr:hypothetical protein FB451DRAFT_1418351 [Mycena latifolia]
MSSWSQRCSAQWFDPPRPKFFTGQVPVRPRPQGLGAGGAAAKGWEAAKDRASAGRMNIATASRTNEGQAKDESPGPGRGVFIASPTLIAPGPPRLSIIHKPSVCLADPQFIHPSVHRQPRTAAVQVAQQQTIRLKTHRRAKWRPFRIEGDASVLTPRPFVVPTLSLINAVVCPRRRLVAVAVDDLSDVPALDAGARYVTLAPEIEWLLIYPAYLPVPTPRTTRANRKSRDLHSHLHMCLVPTAHAMYIRRLAALVPRKAPEPDPKNPQLSQPSGCPHASELSAPELTAS